MLKELYLSGHIADVRRLFEVINHCICLWVTAGGLLSWCSLIRHDLANKPVLKDHHDCIMLLRFFPMLGIRQLTILKLLLSTPRLLLHTVVIPKLQEEIMIS